MVLMIGICTGGFLWFPILSYAVARLLLFLYDRYTGNMKYEQFESIEPSAAPVAASRVFPIAPPDLSGLSESDQSLVNYIADGSIRGMTTLEMQLILKGNGWQEADVKRGFEMARLYYKNVVK